MLRDRAEGWAALDIDFDRTQSWPDNDPFCVHVDLIDEHYGLVYGTLRIDYDGERLIGGWSDGQLVHPIDLTRPDAFEAGPFGSPEAAGEYAARWFEAQLCRPVERREWRTGSQVTYRLWLLVDTSFELCASGPGLPPSEPRGPWHEGRPAPTGAVTVIQLRPARTRPSG